jgi:hypothetical protein
MKRTVGILVSSLLVCAGTLFAQTEPLTRDEVASLKRKLQATLDALGKAPEGYVKESENFYLPTEASKISSGGYYPLTPSVSFKFGSGDKSKKSEKDLEKEFKKKFAEAQAKGDVQEMMRLSQEMQKKMGEMQMDAIAAEKEPIDLSIAFNSSASETIDPDGVVFESPGVIGLKQSDDDKIRVTILFDPVALKDTKTLSRVDLSLPEEGTKNKASVFNVSIQLNGPEQEVTEWIKRIATAKVLSQISTK